MKELYHAIREDAQKKTLLTTLSGLALNLGYAGYHIFLAVRDAAAWPVLMAVYFAILGMGRALCVLCFRGQRRSSRAPFLSCGVLLLLLSVVLGVSVCFSLRFPVIRGKNLIPMIASAAYTFSKLTFAVIGFSGKRRRQGLPVEIVRHIAFADAAASMLTLERMMIISLSAENRIFYRDMTAAVGAGVIACVVTLGISLLRRGINLRRK